MFNTLRRLRKSFQTSSVPALSKVAIAEDREDIKAAARAWRARLANARLGSKWDANLDTTVSEPLTALELDAFERALAYGFAQALVYCPDHPLFTEKGSSVAIYVLNAALDTCWSKFEYWGFYDRMRILPKEVAQEQAPYGSGNWRVDWQAT